MGFGVRLRLGFGVRGLDFVTYELGSGFRVQGSGFRVQGSGVQGFRGARFRVQGFRVRVKALFQIRVHILFSLRRLLVNLRYQHRPNHPLNPKP